MTDRDDDDDELDALLRERLPRYAAPAALRARLAAHAAAAPTSRRAPTAPAVTGARGGATARLVAVGDERARRRDARPRRRCRCGSRRSCSATAGSTKP